MKYTILLIIALLFFTSCNIQEKGDISKEELQQLFEKEKKNEERAKYKNDSNIQVITNPQEVVRLKNYIAEKKSEKLKGESTAKSKKTLVDMYKAGDKSTVSLIINTLNSDDTKAKKEIYKNLSRGFDESEDYQIIEPELIKTILKNISIPEDEKFVIQLAGFMDIKGYPEVFEERLLSGESQDEDRLIYWLGNDGTSQKTLDYIEKLIFSKGFDLEAKNYVISGLKGFAENGNTETKKRAVEISLKIYDQKLIPKEKFEAIKTSWNSANPASSLVDILLNSDDKRVIPIAKQFVENGIRDGEALATLVKIEGDKHKEFVFKYLENQDKFFDGLNAASRMYKISKDKNIVETVFREFEKQKEHPGYSIDRVVSAIISMEATEYFSKLDTVLKSKELIRAFLKHYDLTKGSIETVAKDLYEFGVVSKPISQDVINKAKRLSNSEKTGGYVYDLLSLSKLYQWFDAETDSLPVDYDNLILEFSKNSNDKLKDIEVWMDADVDENNNVSYKILVSANDKIYIISPKDIGDWYDVQLTINLMNAIAKDANLKERYVFIDTGDQSVQTLFGPPKNVNQFIEKYNL